MYAVSIEQSFINSAANSIQENTESNEYNPHDYNDQLADKITILAGQINAANYRFLKLIAEFDRREAWEGPGIRSCAYWLNWKCGISVGVAREKVRVARALEELPEINEAFEKGELSYSKVRAMTRAATDLNESYLLNIAQYGTAQHVEKLVGIFRTVSRVEDFAGSDAISVMGELDESVVVSDDEFDQRREQKLYESRSVSCYQDDEGMWIINAKLPAEEGGLLVKVLQELGNNLATTNLKESSVQDKKDQKGEQKNDEKIAAATFSDYKKDDLSASSLLGEQLLPKEEPLTFPQRRADALTTIAESFLAKTGGDDERSEFSTLKGAERCQLVLHVHHGRAGSIGSDGNSDAKDDVQLDADLDGRWLVPDAALRLACDAALQVVEEDAVGNVLNIGRRSRIIPAAMSRALSIRDGSCQFPGCCETRFVEGHHIKHWANGGDTKLENLVTLCRYHHRELHRGKFFISVKSEANKLERFVDRLCFSTVDRYFDSPFNRSKDFVIAPNPAKFTCACCDGSVLEKTLPRVVYDGIDENTAVTKWQGEQMDLGMAIEGLIRASGRSVNGKN
ncbi:MAG: DUF222 domain-containing protein [Oleispira sp.]|nr:DUF222 domain-containing protein [Oleispira sp.]MBL4881788.1 DUF222 domain-containing protein [Oleispira sp.]